MHARSAHLRRLRWLPPLLPLLPILAGLLLTAGRAGAGDLAADPGALHPLTLATSRLANPASATVLPAGSGALVALVRGATLLRRTPGGRALARIGARSDFGSPQALWVRQVRGRWLGVVSPEAGNGRLGWILRGLAILSRVAWQLRVSLAARQLTVLERGRALEHFTVAIGQPSAPTPTGSFAVTDRLLTGDPSGPYGCCILALSARAPHAIQGWSGGDRIAIHSTPETATLGEPVSHGCLRLTLAEGRWLLAHVPLGTPVHISSA
jgi:L,D-transpeptidase-like protein